MEKLKKDPKRLSVERIYQKKTQLEHILLRPDSYIGSVEPVTQVRSFKISLTVMCIFKAVFCLFCFLTAQLWFLLNEHMQAPCDYLTFFISKCGCLMRMLD